MLNFTGLKETKRIYYKKNLSCEKRVDEDDICYEWIAIWTLLECSSILQEDGVLVFYQDSMCSLGEVTWMDRGFLKLGSLLIVQSLVRRYLKCN